MRSLERSAARQDLSAFLRSRRERLSPLEVGLVPGPRRRAPGLRREEVAQLAGVGITWYTWFEQGREIQVSTHFLDNLARALRLDATERGHLFALAQRRPPPRLPTAPATVTPAMQRMLDSLPHPAYIKTTRWDLVAWNAAMDRLSGDYALIPPERRNLVWLLFTDPRRRQCMVDWEGDARRVLAKFRVDAGRAGDDPAFAQLIRELDEASPEFHQWWPQQDVRGAGEGMKRLRHRELGEIEFEHAAFVVDGAPDLYLVIYTPVAGVSAAKARRLFGRR